MKRFDIITESDARVLPRGETVLVAEHLLLVERRLVSA